MPDEIKNKYLYGLNEWEFISKGNVIISYIGYIIFSIVLSAIIILIILMIEDSDDSMFFFVFMFLFITPFILLRMIIVAYSHTYYEKNCWKYSIPGYDQKEKLGYIKKHVVAWNRRDKTIEYIDAELQSSNIKYKKSEEKKTKLSPQITIFRLEPDNIEIKACVDDDAVISIYIGNFPDNNKDLFHQGLRPLLDRVIIKIKNKFEMVVYR